MSRTPSRLAVAGGPYATGTIANLAPGTTADLVVDLGADWPTFDMAQISISAQGSTGTVGVYAGDTATPSTARPLADLQNGAPMVDAGLNAVLTSMVPPMGQYLFLKVKNTGASAFPASATFAVCAYA